MANSAKPRVTIVCSDLSGNALGRALLLAELCTPDYVPAVIGIQSQPSTWSPASSFDIPLEGRRIHDATDYWSSARWIAERALGSKVIVCKPTPTSLGLALMAGLRRRETLLDVDDWDVGFARPSARRLRVLLHPREMNTYFGTVALFRTVPFFPRRLVSNAWLRERYGGTLLTHVRDTAVLDPERRDGAALRLRLALGPGPWIGFIGTVRSHKGVEDLIDAIARMAPRCRAGLLLAGLDLSNPYAQRLAEQARHALGEGQVRILPAFPFAELPDVLALPDVICIPSRPTPATSGQIPAKLFDGMAMAKATLVSDAHPTSDVPSDAFVRFPAGDVGALSAALERLCLDPEGREALGRRARRVAVEQFSYTAARPVLMKVLSELPTFERSRSAAAE